MVNYGKIIEKKTLALKARERSLDNLENHLLYHPTDYQARVASMLTHSDILNRRKQLGELEFLEKVEKYR